MRAEMALMQNWMANGYWIERPEPLQQLRELRGTYLERLPSDLLAMALSELPGQRKRVKDRLRELKLMLQGKLAYTSFAP